MKSGAFRSSGSGGALSGMSGGSLSVFLLRLLIRFQWGEFRNVRHEI